MAESVKSLYLESKRIPPYLERHRFFRQLSIFFSDSSWLLSSPLPFLSPPLSSTPVFLISRLRTNNALSTTITAAGNTVYRQDIEFFARPIFSCCVAYYRINQLDRLEHVNEPDGFVLDYIYMDEIHFHDGMINYRYDSRSHFFYGVSNYSVSWGERRGIEGKY